MGTVIDDKTVKLDFDNKKFEAGTRESLESVNKLKKGLNFTDSTKSLSSIDNSLKKMSLGAVADGVDAIKNRFSLLGIVGLNVINSITQRAMQMVQQLTSTFITDPIKMGLEEYETQINAIQTILANTAAKGTTLEEVNEKLGELNTYADKTIYNFTEMTRNIGTFTAAGVDLNTSVDAIKGIANLAAVSGSNSQQAATAMYQLSQALSSGTVKLMDWNSVVNAGMGGQVFQDALKETARLHGITIDKMIEDEGSFRETLSEGWLSADILTETLKKFTGDLSQSQIEALGYTTEQAEEIVKLGQMANDAATKVKTLTQLTDTLKEAAQSGWTQTWEILIGDFEEAKLLFSSVSDIFGEMIGNSAASRNELLSAWKDLGGRDDLLRAMYESIYRLQEVFALVGESLREIFPPTTAQQLKAISQAIQEFVMNIKIAGKPAETMKRIFKGFFALIDIGRLFIVSLAKNLKILTAGFEGAIPGFFEMVAKLGDWIVALRESIKSGEKFDVFFNKLFTKIKPAIDGIVGLIGGLIAKIKGIKTPELKPLGDLGDSFASLKARFKGSESGANGMGRILGLLGDAMEKFAPIADKVGELIVKAFNGFLDGVENFIDNFDPEKVLKVLNGGLFAGVLLSVKGFIDSSKAVVGAGMFAAILKSVKDFIDKGGNVFEGVTGILTGVKDVLGAYQKDLKANALLKIAAAIGILALSILALAFVDPTRLAAATAAISALFLGLMTSMNVFEKGTGGIKQMATATATLLGISVAMLIMAGALRLIATLDPNELAIGLGSITALLAAMIGFTKFVNSDKGILFATTAMFGLASSLYVMAKSLKAFSDIPLEKVGNGLLAMGGTLSILILAMNLLPKDGMASKAFGILVVSASLIILAKALEILGGLTWDQVAVGLVTLAGSLTILAVAMTAMQGSLTGAAALLVSAAAVGILAVALQTMANLKLEQIGIALLALVGVFTVLGLAGYILTPVVPVLLGLAAAMLLIGVAGLALGVGVLAFSAGIAALSVAAAGGIAAITILITGLAKVLPVLAEGIANGIVTLISTIASKGKELAGSFLSLLRTGITAFVEIIPELTVAAFNMITAFLTTIRDNIGEVVTIGSDIVINFMDAMAAKIPELVDSAFELVIAVIDGMADAVEQNLPRLINSITKLGVSIVQGLLDGMYNARHTLLNGVRDLANTVLSEFKSALGIRSPSKAFYRTVADISDGLLNGFRDFGPRMADGARDVADNVVSVFDPVGNAIAQSLDKNLDLDPKITPVVDLTDISESGKELDKMFGSKSFGIGLSRRTAQQVSGATDVYERPLSSSQESVQSPITFIQNNTSPKELSSSEIYRLTKKQLFQTRRLGA